MSEHGMKYGNGLVPVPPVRHAQCTNNTHQSPTRVIANQRRSVGVAIFPPSLVLRLSSAVSRPSSLVPSLSLRTSPQTGVAICRRRKLRIVHFDASVKNHSLRTPPLQTGPASLGSRLGGREHGRPTVPRPTSSVPRPSSLVLRMHHPSSPAHTRSVAQPVRSCTKCSPLA